MAARRLRIGVQLPEVEREVRWPELRAIARAAEAVGFDSVWVGDHLLYRGDGRPERGPWEAWTTLAALAASTERVALGPLVACLAFHPPAVLAKQAAMVAEVGGGRLVLGVGAGWNADEFRAFGLPYDHRVSRFEEAWAILRGMLAGERVTLHGRFHTVQDVLLLPPPAARVPLVVGSNGPRMLSIALPDADGWNTWWADYGNTPDGFGALNARISDAACAAGRDPGSLDRSACVLVGVDGGAGERAPDPDAPAVPLERLPEHLDALASAGADEAILVLDPITETSVRALAPVLAGLGTLVARGLGGN
ncbi:MAG: Pyrimidine monooxygenase RutA [Solirubrobacterales bacterium]|nr:Pyrimidine monooxygenase RutA [Solirubrobacterales bacterium]